MKIHEQNWRNLCRSSQIYQTPLAIHCSLVGSPCMIHRFSSFTHLVSSWLVWSRLGSARQSSISGSVRPNLFPFGFRLDIGFRLSSGRLALIALAWGQSRLRGLAWARTRSLVWLGSVGLGSRLGLVSCSAGLILAQTERITKGWVHNWNVLRNRTALSMVGRTCCFGRRHVKYYFNLIWIFWKSEKVKDFNGHQRKSETK